MSPDEYEAQSEWQARELDSSYRRFVASKALAGQALRNLIQTTRELAKQVAETRALVRGPFGKWCVRFCKVFNPVVAKAVSSVASQTVGDKVESWQLRILGVLHTVHHNARPKSATIKATASGWMTHMTKATADLTRMIERAGGIDNMETHERAAISRQFGQIDKLRDRITPKL